MTSKASSLEPKYYGDIRLDTENNQWVIENLLPHVSLRFKQVFTKISIGAICPFRLQASNDISADIDWFTMRYPLRVSDKEGRVLRKRARKFKAFHAELGAITLPDWKPSERVGLREGEALIDYQKVCLDFVERTRRCLVIDDVGLGKTYEGLGVGLLPDSLPMVVVVKPDLQKQWVKKAKSFVDMEVFAPQGNTPKTLPPADVYIFKFSQLASWVEVLCENWVRALVFDEVQHLRTGDESEKGKAARKICESVASRDGCIVGLSATHQYNYGVETFTICDIINPGCLGTRQDFIREWCCGDSKGKVQDPDALGTYLREIGMMIRRTKKDVGQVEKGKRPELLWVPPDLEGLAGAEELATQLAMTSLNGGFSESGQAARTFDLRLRQMTGIAKARAGAAIAKIFLDNKVPLLMFAWHREVYRILKEELANYNPVFYTGSETAAQKNRSTERFLSGESDCLIMSVRSGEGVDGLQDRCSHVLSLELDWSPAVLEQNRGRVDRDNPVFDVHAYYVVTNYGSDPTMLDVLGYKENQSHGILNPGQPRDVRDIDTDRFKSLAKNYLATKGVKTQYQPEIITSSDQALKQIKFL